MLPLRHFTSPKWHKDLFIYCPKIMVFCLPCCLLPSLSGSYKKVEFMSMVLCPLPAISLVRIARRILHLPALKETWVIATDTPSPASSSVTAPQWNSCPSLLLMATCNPFWRSLSKDGWLWSWCQPGFLPWLWPNGCCHTSVMLTGQLCTDLLSYRWSF